MIEVKVGAKENRYIEADEKNYYGQIEKYLRLNQGYVCFIAKEEGEIDIENNKDKYLGQFEWFEIYRLLTDYARNNKLDNVNKFIINNFLGFMKNLDMQPFSGFSRQDVELSAFDYFTFMDKLKNFFLLVMKDTGIKSFCKKHNLEVTKASPKFYEKYNQVILFLEKKKWKGSIIIELGFYYDNEPTADRKSDLYFYQGIGMAPKRIFEENKTAVKDIKLNKKYFNNAIDDYDYWIINGEKVFSDFIKKGEGEAVKFIYESFLELERSGVIAELDKIEI